MLEVVEAVDGRQNTFNCQEIRRNNPYEPKLKKMKLPVFSIAGAMYEADNAWRDVLRKKKLSDLAKDIQISVDKKFWKSLQSGLRKKFKEVLCYMFCLFGSSLPLAF